MLLRLILENILSFKDAVEFNTFPSSKTHSHGNHKIVCGNAVALRLAAIYGANAAGKSNLLSALSLMQNIVLSSSLNSMKLPEDPRFRYDDSCKQKPSGMAVEFYEKGHILYYQIEFVEHKIVSEKLLYCKKTTDVEVFSREGENLKINADLLAKGFNNAFVQALSRLVKQDMVLLSFLGRNYPEALRFVPEAFSWFSERLQIVLPGTITGTLPHRMDTDPSFKDMVNSILPEMNTGILRLEVRKEPISEESVIEDTWLKTAIIAAKRLPGVPQKFADNSTLSVHNIVYEDGVVYRKSLVAYYKDLKGREYESAMAMESDGTRRLIEYMPLFYAILSQGGVFVVDEIERSIHPILIKDIVRKISESKSANGQLIFTTHESGLLDQAVLRPDEIWFAQKDVEQATQLYPLSDFNVHHTTRIENGYLNGRYGGIPFLNNLKDLHW